MPPDTYSEAALRGGGARSWIVRGGHRLALAAVVAAGWACQGEPPEVKPAAPEITIIASTDSPQRLEVPQGATVVVLNFDPFQHTVTSSSAPGTYTLGAVDGISFDTGPIAGNGNGAFTIPASAPVGTVVPLFCNIHRETTGEGGEIVVVPGPP